MPQRWLAIGGMVVLFIAVNVACYLLPIDYTFLGNYTFAGVFVVTALATATIVVPVPYIPILMRIAEQQQSPTALLMIALAAGLGSVVGEISGYLVGRAGRSAFATSRFSQWVAVQMQHPVRSFVALFALSAPPNPLFDVAGMAAGTFGVPFGWFALAVFLGRFVRMAGILFITIWLGNGGVGL